MKAVNFPGSLASSAALMVPCQAAMYPGVPGLYWISFGNLPCAKVVTMSIDRLLRSLPACIMSYHFLAIGTGSSSGLPALRSVINPIWSE